MKLSKRFMALFLAAAMTSSMLAACSSPAASGDTNSAESTSGTESTGESTTGDSAAADASGETRSGDSDTLVAASNHFEGKFSPFFAQSAEDIDIVTLVTPPILRADVKVLLFITVLKARHVPITAQTTPIMVWQIWQLQKMRTDLFIMILRSVMISPLPMAHQ